MFVPGIRLTSFVQLLPLKVSTGFQPPLFNCTQTFDTATLSVALPFTVKAALVTFSPTGTLVILTVGRFVSTKLTMKERLDVIRNWNTALLETTLPEPSAQFTKPNPGLAVAVRV